MLYVTIIFTAVGGAVLGAGSAWLRRKNRKAGDTAISRAIWGALFGAVLGYIFLPTPNIEKVLADVPQANTFTQFNKAVLQSDRPVLVDFYATWCPPCKRLAPTIAKLAKDFRGRAGVVRVNGDQAGELLRMYKVDAFPTTMIFKHGKPVKTFVGLHLPSAYRQALEKALPQGEKSKG